MPPRPAGREVDDAPLRAAIVAAGRRLRAAGLVAATEGNLSVRAGADVLLITPAGRRKDELAPEDLVVAPIVAQGDAADPERGGGPRPSSDVAIHRAAYAARPDVLAVVHAHLPASLALTLAGEAPDPAVLPETAILLPNLPLVPFGQPGSDELARRVGAALAGEGGSSGETLPGAVLLERHGAVAVGDAGTAGLAAGLTAGTAVAAIELAVDRLELVEVLCRAWRDALLIRAASTGGSGRAILRPPSPPPAGPARGRA